MLFALRNRLHAPFAVSTRLAQIPTARPNIVLQQLFQALSFPYSGILAFFYTRILKQSREF